MNKLQLRELRDRLARSQGMRCYYCKRRMTKAGSGHMRAVTLDHVIPQCVGGTLSNGNGVAACFTCNQAKAELPADVFFEVLAQDAADALPAAVVQPQHPSHDGQAQSASPNGDDAREFGL